jgi:tRNA(fMet)-specific endonuclease VapC
VNRLLDTNICIYLIKRKPISVWRRFQDFKPGEIVVSSITVAELQYGVYKSRDIPRNQQALNEFLLPLTLESFDSAATVHYGQLRASLEAAGMPIGAFDLLIAAHTLALGVTLVTNNVREFSRIPTLSTENWVEEDNG